MEETIMGSKKKGILDRIKEGEEVGASPVRHAGDDGGPELLHGDIKWRGVGWRGRAELVLQVSRLHARENRHGLNVGVVVGDEVHGLVEVGANIFRVERLKRGLVAGQGGEGHWVGVQAAHFCRRCEAWLNEVELARFAAGEQEE